TRCLSDWSSDVCSSDLGMESGFMTPQIAAAALVADCRILATPASVQSVPTEGNQEDVVPMGMSAAWKAERILANATRIVAIELRSEERRVGKECRSRGG